MEMIRIEENGLRVAFRVREDGVTELVDFSSSEAEGWKEKEAVPEIAYPLIELHYTGTTTTGMHGYKHNLNASSLELTYEGHRMEPREGGKELVIALKSERGIHGDYHMRLFDGIPVVQVWTVLCNDGAEEVGLEYVSSFIYQGISANGALPYFKKTDIYVPRNSWSCEAQWQKYDAAELNLSGMLSDGFGHPGFGLNRYCYTGKGSWSSCEYLPMGYASDRETGETYGFQVEASGQWHIEYGSGEGGRLYLALSGPAESEHGWWKCLRPGESFETVPAAFGVVKGGVSEATAALTRYRREIRRPNTDDERLNVVFNDYMNCLMGDPTEEREKAIIDKAAEMGCEYYCLDCGWYDKGYWWDRVGEWAESPERFPNGLRAVCDYANAKGMKMGLWLEIEVMGTACALAEKLPDDWFICRHGKRHIDNKRYLLDFRNPEVRAYCRGVVDRLIRDYGVEYFKVDYNVTMGYGSDRMSDSCSDAILEHYRCLYQWYREIFEAYPELVIENCGSGGQRMDYGMLKILSLQSTSDQTDYLYNSYIAANVASAVTPEQAGMWVYPYEDEEEHVIYNMVNGLLLRPYMSGMVWKLGERSMALLQEGVSLYKEIRGNLKAGTPFFPLSFCQVGDPALAYGVQSGETVYLALFTPGAKEAEIPLALGEVKEVSVIYPAPAKESDGNNPWKGTASGCAYEYEPEGSDCGVLHVAMPGEKTARLFRIQL